jgi:uncharacterized protein YecT (DUF1311 family)
MSLNLRAITVSALILPLWNVAISPSFAQDNKQQIAQRINCKNPQTTTEMNVCADRDYQAADQKLNQVYRQLQAKLSGKQKQRMTNAQLAWIKFRDTNCNYEKGQFEGGTMAGPIVTSCLARMTEQRTQELEEYLQDTTR